MKIAHPLAHHCSKMGLGLTMSVAPQGPAYSVEESAAWHREQTNVPANVAKKVFLVRHMCSMIVIQAQAY